MQELFFCELKAPGGTCSTLWNLNSCDKVNPTSLVGYDVQQKRKNLFHLRNCDIKLRLHLSRFSFNS